MEQRVGRSAFAAALPLALRRNGDDDLLIALEDRPRAGPERQPAVSIRAKRIASDQRASDGANKRALLGRSNAEDAQSMMAEALHLLSLVSGEHVGEMPDAEPHVGAERSRQQLARDVGGVDGCRRIEAIVAIAAALRRVLPKVPQKHGAAAKRRFDERRKRIQPLALGWAAVGIDFLLNPLPGAGEILRRPE